MKKKILSLFMIIAITIFQFAPTMVSATTTIRQGNKIVNTTTSETLTFDEREHNSTIYAGEIKKDGVTVLNYLYSDDVTRSAVLFDNVRIALSNPYSDMVPSIINEQTELGLKELSVSTLNGINLSTITSGWTNASNIATQIYNGTNTDIVNSNMYDVDNEFKTEVDNNDAERAVIDNPIENNKRIISHLGTQTHDDVNYQVVDGDLIEVHNVDLTYFSEATTVIYTSVNVTTTPATTYTVTFNTDGGSTIPNQTVAEGSKVTRPADPTKDGYEFMFWSSDTGIDINDEITSNVTFTALWTRKFNITKGPDQTFYLESDKDIAIVSDGPFDEFDGFALYYGENGNSIIDMDDLTEGTDYVLEDGSTKLTLKNSFLKTLGADKYYVEFYYYNPTTYGYGYTDTTLTVKAGSEPATPTETSNTTDTTTYEYIDNTANQKYTINENDTLTFRINADYSLFENGGKVYLDNTLVSSDNYTSKSGSTIITFTKDYTSSLSEGEHTLKVTFNNGGSATTKFTVAKASTTTENTNTTENPHTGDNIMFYISMLGLSIIGFAGAGLYIRKKRFN